MSTAPDRERHALRGPVRKVTTESIGESGGRVEEQLFDRNGELGSQRVQNPNGSEHFIRFRDDQGVKNFGPDRRVIPNEDGSLTEIHDVSAVNAWSVGGLRQCGFGTWGAAFARTQFDRQGTPIETIFEDNRHQEQHRIHYVCDASGNILEAVQYSASTVSSLAPVWTALESGGIPVSGPVKALEPGAEQFRMSFRYDDAGRVIEQETFFSGKRIGHSEKTYNEQGDVLVWIEDERPARFEYKYDRHGNWVHKVANYSPPNPQEEYRRTIEYYDE